MAAGQEHPREGGYLDTIKQNQQLGLAIGPGLMVETPTVKEGVDVSASLVATSETTVSWSAPDQQTADAQLGPLVQAKLLGGTLPEPAVVDRQQGMKGTVEAQAGDGVLGAKVTVEPETKQGVKTTADSAVYYSSTGGAVNGQINVAGVVSVVGSVKGEEQAALTFGAGGPVASLKLTGEQTSGIQSAPDALVAKGVSGSKTELEIKLPVGLSDLVSGRTLTASTITLKQTDTATGEATYGATLAADPYGARLAVEGKLSSKQETLRSTWTSTIGDAIQSGLQGITGGQ